MGMKRDWRIKNSLNHPNCQQNSTVFLLIKNSPKALGYIYDNKLWESFYVLFKIISTFKRLILLVDSNHAVMVKFYDHSRITKQCIEKIYDVTPVTLEHTERTSFPRQQSCLVLARTNIAVKLPIQT